ncbi:MAG: histone deacetylase family protein [Spirochaetes bacterium]|nr:histone deacetylase family protein [Spirochaetota bacterium]
MSRIISTTVNQSETDFSEEQKKNIRIIFHPDYTKNYNTAACESPGRVTSIMELIGDMFDIMEPEPCTENDILSCHSQGLIYMERTDPLRFEVAMMSAGGAMLASDMAIEGYISFAVIRPPGHHSNPDHNWGFCFLNNMGIAVMRLIKLKKITDAVILDIDLHYGDGTEAIFNSYENVRVINIQSSTPDVFMSDIDSQLGKIEKTDIIGLSAGFDQYLKDWGQNLTTGDFYKIGFKSGRFAREKSGGRIFGVLEGGYYIPELGKNFISLLKGMADGRNPE